MAKGKKTGGRDWVRGQVPNPRGAAAHSPEKKAMRRLTQAQVAEVATMILNGKIDDLIKIVGSQKDKIPPDPDASPLKIWFATVALKAISKGDMSSLDIFLNRTVGKVKDKIELSGEDGGPIAVNLMSDDELKKTLKELLGEP